MCVILEVGETNTERCDIWGNIMVWFVINLINDDITLKIIL